MGVYEIITGITENEENLKVEIRQTEGTLERNLVYIKNTRTNRAYSFTLADGDEYGADAMTRNAVAKLHSDMYGCNEDTLDRIEHALGIKLETWQSEYILSQGIAYPHEGRRTGKTLAYQIKTLLIAHNDITIYGNEAQKKVHDVKLGTTFFDDVKTGRKTFELRKNDRGYKEGDTIVLHEYKDGTTTGRTITKKIVYMLEDFTGLEDGYCILGLGEVEETLREAAAGAGQDADNRTLQYGA